MFSFIFTCCDEEPTALPHQVQGAKYAEAEGKLWWGYSQLVADSQNSRSQQMQIGTLPSCDHRKQRRQMLYFLIPLRIRKGILPSQELLKSYDLDGVFGKLVDAIRAGDLALYELAAKEQTLVFVKLGTCLLRTDRCSDAALRF